VQRGMVERLANCAAWNGRAVGELLISKVMKKSDCCQM
jgi:hypothetical protein